MKEFSFTDEDMKVDSVVFHMGSEGTFTVPLMSAKVFFDLVKLHDGNEAMLGEALVGYLTSHGVPMDVLPMKTYVQVIEAFSSSMTTNLTDAKTKKK